MTNVLSCRALGAGQDLKEFDVDNYYGLAALTRILDDCVGKKLHMEAVQARTQHCLPSTATWLLSLLVGACFLWHACSAVLGASSTPVMTLSSQLLS